MTRYYTAAEASARLGVSRNTLYAYVSRSLIRSEAVEGSRGRRYHALDIERLATRSEVHKAPRQALQKAVDWGAPLLESAITLIGDDCFYYRGRSALELAAAQSFEQTAALLWETPIATPLTIDSALRSELESVINQAEPEDPIDCFLMLLAWLNRRDIAAFDFSPAATATAGKIQLTSLVRILSGDWPRTGVAAQLAESWQLAPEYTPLLDAALTLVADHELNIASFTARCTASAGCSPHAALAAATHTFFGRRHGGNTERIAGLFYEADGRGSLYEAIASRLRRGETIPGFGHRLYDIDPRAQFLLSRLPDRCGYLAQAQEAARSLLQGRYPSVDFALIALERDLELPPQSGARLFYLGRVAGLVAHIMEQYGQNRPIRPRAHYIGVRPTTEGEAS